MTGDSPVLQPLAPLRSGPVWITSDLHLGHRAIAKYRPWVDSMESNTTFIRDFWERHVSKRSHIWVLGDAAFDYDHWALLQSWNGAAMRVVLGNHELQGSPRYVGHPPGCGPVYGPRNGGPLPTQVYGLKKKYGFWLSHAPLHPVELRGKLNIHGHVHDKTLDDLRYFNVSVDNLMVLWGQPMISLDQLRAWIIHRANNCSLFPRELAAVRRVFPA